MVIAARLADGARHHGLAVIAPMVAAPQSRSRQ